MVVKSKGVPNAYGKELCSRCFSVMNRNKMSKKKKKGSIVSDHNLNKSIITTCIAKYENSYMLYNDFRKILFLPRSNQLPSLQ